MLPTLDMWDVLHGANAAVAFHLYLMAQPPGLPEQMIEATADAFFGYFLDAWTRNPDAMPAEIRAEYDCRASAGIDAEHDRADRDSGRRLAMPVTVVQQNWGDALGYDAVALWRAWAPDLVHRTTDAGHFMAEESPREIVAVLRDLLVR
ncbi:hypothetical protein [Rhodococcus hoagii]|uniref:hypothetical protein n=1 Tax=Rhodococcus hoagii TaxID=43767 RepID=UPI0007CD447C